MGRAGFEPAAVSRAAVRRREYHRFDSSRLALLELARVFVCVDYVASRIVNANHGIM